MFLINKINKIALSSNVDKRIQSINSTERYGYGTSKYLICKKEKNKQISILKTIQECLPLIDYVINVGIERQS